jgi:cytochrome P450
MKLESLFLKRRELLKHDPNEAEPRDHLQLMMRYAQKHKPEELNSPEDIAGRIILANFASMHQTALQVVNMLLNIVGSDPEFNTISILRDEIGRVLGGTPSWNKAKVAQMTRADSVARETLRLCSFGGRSVMRKALVDGLVTEDGTRLPKGAMISFLGRPAQVDAEKIDNPLQFDPFRFSREREAAADEHGKPGCAHLSFVSTSPEHLPFGHGKYACPGRFLVDFELKMIISYVLMNYDIKFPPEYNGQRPENIWRAEANCPPDGARLLVKRRNPETQ